MDTPLAFHTSSEDPSLGAADFGYGRLSASSPLENAARLVSESLCGREAGGTLIVLHDRRIGRESGYLANQLLSVAIANCVDLD